MKKNLSFFKKNNVSIKIITIFLFTFITVFFLSSLYFYFYKIKVLPLGYYYDNLSIVANSVCLNEMGVDEYGYSYPIFFLSFGDYKLPMTPYFLSLIHNIIPIDLFLSRVITSILGLIGLLVIYLGIKKGKFNLNLLFAFIFISSNILISSSFWAIQRSGFEVGYTLAYNSLIFFFCTMGLKRKNNIHSWIGVGLIILSIFLYQSYKVIFIPLLIFYFILLFLREKFNRSQLIFVTFLSLCIIFSFIFINSEVFFSRFKQISGDPKISPLNIISILNLYFKHFNLDFLFFHGDYNYRHSIGKIGTFSLALIIPFLIGFFLSMKYLILQKNRKSFQYSFNLFILFFFLIGFFPASLLKDGIPHAIRSYNIVLSFIIYSINGFYFLIVFSLNLKNNKNKVLGFRFLIFLSILFSISYFKDFIRKIEVYPMISYFSQAYWTEDQIPYVNELLANKDTVTQDYINMHKKNSRKDLLQYSKYEEILVKHDFSYCSNKLPNQ